MGSLLIKNATVVTMDSALGDITGGDILIVDGRIVDVACWMHSPPRPSARDWHGAFREPRT